MQGGGSATARRAGLAARGWPRPWPRHARRRATACCSRGRLSLGAAADTVPPEAHPQLSRCCPEQESTHTHTHTHTHTYTRALTHTYLVVLAPVHIGAPSHARGVQHMRGLHLQRSTGGSGGDSWSARLTQRGARRGQPSKQMRPRRRPERLPARALLMQAAPGRDADTGLPRAAPAQCPPARRRGPPGARCHTRTGRPADSGARPPGRLQRGNAGGA